MHEQACSICINMMACMVTFDKKHEPSIHAVSMHHDIVTYTYTYTYTYTCHSPQSHEIDVISFTSILIQYTRIRCFLCRDGVGPGDDVGRHTAREIMHGTPARDIRQMMNSSIHERVHVRCAVHVLVLNAWCAVLCVLTIRVVSLL